jgi:magnesium-transporting ATPase (P-type)
LIRDLRTNVKQGINSNSNKERELTFGHNRKPKAKLKSLLSLFIESLDDFTLKILIVAAIVSISIILKLVVV